MDADTPNLSDAFRRLYCDATVFERISVFHPVSCTRVLPFQLQDPVLDNPALLGAEAAHLSHPSDATRLAVVEAFGRCNLLSASDVSSLKLVIDSFDADFFELMGEVYANAGMFICALRWHREFIAELEERRPNTISDRESVYASVGYCLFSLGLYPEAITWSKSCIGPHQTVDLISRTLIDYEARSQAGCIQAIERSASRTRFTVSASDPAQALELTSRLKSELSTFAPLQETYIDWISSESTMPGIQPEGYPFRAERDAGALPRHRMNLIFSLCARADELAIQGHVAEARQLLLEANLFEPNADPVRERLRATP